MISDLFAAVQEAAMKIFTREEIQGMIPEEINAQTLLEAWEKREDMSALKESFRETAADES